MSQKRKFNQNDNEDSPIHHPAKVFKNEDEVVTVEDGLNFIKTIFPYQLFKNRIPAVIWRHQLYALIDDRTKVDKELDQLIEKGILRTFLMGSTMGKHELALCFTTEYKSLIKQVLKSHLFSKFWSILESNSDCKFSKDDLIEKYKLNELIIKELVQLGCLSLHRSVGFYILSIPSMGDYSKKLDEGRKAVLNVIKRSKFKEMLKSNLIARKMPFDVKLPIVYHILDLIGSDKVESIAGPTGPILRYKN